MIMKKIKLKTIGDRLPNKIIEIREDRAKEMLKNNDCILLGDTIKPKKKKVNYDLNNDGVFDKKDKTIASEIMRKKYGK